MKITDIQNAISGIKLPEVSKPVAQINDQKIEGTLALNPDVLETANLNPTTKPTMVSSKAHKNDGIQELLASFQEGIEIMHLPKIGKKVLLRKGALRIFNHFGYKYHTELVDKTFDGEHRFIAYTFKAIIVTSDGEYVCEAIGSASTAEKKFGGDLSSNSLVAAMAAKRALVAAAKDLLI